MRSEPCLLLGILRGEDEVEVGGQCSLPVEWARFRKVERLKVKNLLGRKDHLQCPQGEKNMHKGGTGLNRREA